MESIPSKLPDHYISRTKNRISRDVPYITLDEIPGYYIFYTKSRICRDFAIWKLGMDQEKELTYKQIGKNVGCSESVASQAFRRIMAIGTHEDILEYFKMGFDLHDIILELGGDPNLHLNYLLNAMLRFGLNKRSLVKNLSLPKVEEFLAQRSMHNAGKIVKEAFREYRYRLKHHKRYF